MVVRPLSVGILCSPKNLFGYRIQNTVIFSRGVWWVEETVYLSEEIVIINIIIVYILYNIIYYTKSYREVDMSRGARFKNCILYSVSH